MCCEQKDRECIEAMRAMEEASDKVKAYGFARATKPLYYQDFEAYAPVVDDFLAKEQRYFDTTRASTEAHRLHR